MIRQFQNSATLPGFTTPFDRQLNANNRWVLWSAQIPWSALSSIYEDKMNPTQGRPAKGSVAFVALWLAIGYSRSLKRCFYAKDFSVVASSF